MILYFHLFKSFPQFVKIHTVEGFSVVVDTKVDFEARPFIILNIDFSL